MPILWKSLLKAYLRVFSLSTATFLAVLFILRFKEIARFSALSGNWTATGLFAFYQFPLILPIAIPISAFLASFLLMQRLSQTSELTAFRSCTLSFLSLFTPLLFTSLFIALANFSLCAEAAPFCRRASQSMLFQKTSENPLLLLQRQQLGKLKHSYLTVKIEEEGKKASNLYLLLYNKKTERLNLLWASQLTIDGPELKGENVSLISHHPSNQEGFDSLLIENQATLSTEASVISQFLKKTHARAEASALSFKNLLIDYKTNHKPAHLIELLRRSSLSFSVLTFTLLGFAFGIETGRLPSKKNIVAALFLLFALLICYLLAKEFKKSPHLALCSLSLSHLAIWIFSLRRLKKISRGVL